MRRLRHLAACDVCATEATRYRAIVDALAQLPAVAPAPGFADRVMARMPAPTPMARPVYAVPRRMWAAAAGFGALSLGTTAALGAWILSRPDVVSPAISQSWAWIQAASADLLESLNRLASSPVAESTLRLATEQMGLVAVAAGAGMTSYILGCAVLIRILRAPRALHASPAP